MEAFWIFFGVWALLSLFIICYIRRELGSLRLRMGEQMEVKLLKVISDEGRRARFDGKLGKLKIPNRNHRSQLHKRSIGYDYKITTNGAKEENALIHSVHLNEE